MRNHGKPSSSRESPMQFHRILSRLAFERNVSWASPAIPQLVGFEATEAEFGPRSGEFSDGRAGTGRPPPTFQGRPSPAAGTATESPRYPSSGHRREVVTDSGVHSPQLALRRPRQLPGPGRSAIGHAPMQLR